MIKSHRAYSWRQCFMTIILKLIINFKKNSEYLDFDRRILCCLSRGFHPSKWKETSSWFTYSLLTITDCEVGAKRGAEGRGAEGRGAEGRGAEGRGGKGRGGEGRGGEGRRGEGRGGEERGGEGRKQEREKEKEVPFLVCLFPFPLSLSSFPLSFWRLPRWLQLAGSEKQGDICTHLNFIFDFLPRGVYTGINMANLGKEE